MNYWSHKLEFAKEAQLHTDDMEAHHSKEIEACSKATILYGIPKGISKDVATGVQGTNVQMLKTDTVSALFQQSEDSHVVLLNFASYRYPGGKFLHGSSAQEESLCHASFLYDVLSRQTAYYAWNNEHLNRGLYKNRALLSPKVRFFYNGKERLADVLTCAAPNRSCIHYNRFTEEENRQELHSRIEFISSILRHDGYTPDVIILGAFGCGVFAQDAKPSQASSARYAIRHPQKSSTPSQTNGTIDRATKFSTHIHEKTRNHHEEIYTI